MRQTLNAVWLTTSREPAGHGLTSGGLASPELRAAIEQINGKALSPDPIYLPDKTAVRITVKIPSSDRDLSR